MSKVDLTPTKLAEWKKELYRSIDEQVPLPRCLSTKNMLALVEEIEFLQITIKLAFEQLAVAVCNESEAGQ